MSQFNYVPLGFRFQPTDEELVSHFLFKKLTGTLSPFESDLIPFYDLYSNEEPWEVFQRFSPNPLFGHDELYFFTQLKRKPNGSRIQRSVGVGGGSWHGEDSGVRIPVVVIMDEQWVYTEAVKKRFSYRKKGSKVNCGWIMHEFVLTELNSEFVICRLRKIAESRKSELKSAEFELLNTEGEVTALRDEYIDDFIGSLLNI